jgi:hypothetical protein
VPTGLTAVVNGNTLSFTGTPTTAAPFAGSITIRDAAGASVALPFSITINAAPTIGNLTVTQWTSGIAGFTGIMIVAGGTGGLTVYGASGLPAGLTIGLAGNTLSFTGTPTTTGTFTGSVTLQDAVGGHVTKSFTITINAPPAIGSPTTTKWTATKSGFSSTLTITGGTGPLVLKAASGLPAGVTAALSGNTIRLTGTPTTAQTYAAGSITVQDAAGASVTKTFSIVINPPLKITTVTLPSLTMGALFNTTLKTQGGTGPITFAITAGSLPPGVKLSSAGVISGVSRGIGTFTVTITATDSVGYAFSQKLTLSVKL